MARLCVRRTGALSVRLAIILGVALHPTVTYGQEGDLDELKQQMQELMRRNAEQQKQIESLQLKLQSLEARTPPLAQQLQVAEVPAPPQDELEKAIAELEKPTTPGQPARPAAGTRHAALFAQRFGGAQLRLIDISMDVLTAAGGSTERGQVLRDLEGGAHDPNRRGFTLQQAELGLSAAVDPYFNADVFAIFGTDSVELEEAFFTTSQLPYNLQLEGGLFFTEFGRINPIHPHAWRWIDFPVIATRLMGPEQLRSAGFRLGWLAPVPWYSELNVGWQNGNEGDLTISFLDGERGIGGRPAVTDEVKSFRDFIYLTRWANSWDLTDEVTTLIGVSGLFGANSTGDDANTFIYGADVTFTWLPTTNFRRWPFLIWETEFMKRDYWAAAFIAGTEPNGGGGNGGNGHYRGSGEEPDDENGFTMNLPADILRDYGFYTQLQWGFKFPWAAGVRLEYATGSGQSVMDGVLVSRQTDPFRSDRLRVSPLLVYHPTEFSRLRLQYNYDNAKFVRGNDAHSVWLGVEVLYGKHPAHRYGQ